MVRLNPKNTRNMPETDPKPSQPLPFICKSTTPSYYHVVTDRSRSVFGAAKPPTYQIEGLDVARPSKTVASANKKRKQAQTARKERRVPNQHAVDDFQVHTRVSTKSGTIRRDRKYGTLHEFACHPCAGAMLIFSVSFQF